MLSFEPLEGKVNIIIKDFNHNGYVKRGLISYGEEKFNIKF